MIKLNKEASMTIQYAALIMCVALAGVGISPYLQRSISGYWRAGADVFGFGRQYVTPPPPVSEPTEEEIPPEEVIPIPPDLGPDLRKLITLSSVKEVRRAIAEMGGIKEWLEGYMRMRKEGDFYDWDTTKEELLDLFAEGIKADDLQPGDVTPGDVTPGDVTPGDVTPGDVAPGDVAPGDVTPGDVTPGDVAPGDITPGHIATDDISPSASETEGFMTDGLSTQDLYFGGF